MLTFAGHTGTVRCVAYSPDGTRLATGAEDGSLRLWDLAGGAEAHVWPKLADSVEAVAFTPDGSLLLTGLSDGKLVCLPLNGGRRKWEHTAHPAGVRAVLPHPNGVTVFTAGWDREVCSWPLKKPKRDRLCNPLDEPPAAAALSPDGKTLAVSLSHTYKTYLIDTTQGGLNKSLMSDDGSVYSLAFSPDGGLLAAGDNRGRVLLWVLADAKRPRTLEGHTWVVYGLAFTPDGRRLVTASADHTARVWDVGTGRELHVYQWHENWVTCLALSPDGLTVATGGEDNKVTVWDVPD